MNFKTCFLSIFLLLLLSNNTLANDKYLQCLEKITEVRTGNNSIYTKGKELGFSFIKLNLSYAEPSITIHFKFINSKEKPFELIKNKDTNSTSLGFDLDYFSSINNTNSEIKYNFIKIKDSYAFTKKKFWWSEKNVDSNDQEHDYDSSSRCKNINKEQYLSLLKLNSLSDAKTKSYNWAAISKHPKSNKDFIATELSTKKKAINLAMKKCYKFVTQNLNMVGYNDCYLSRTFNDNTQKITDQNQVSSKIMPSNKKDNIIEGTRAFALSWDGLDDLILGTLSFNEKDLIGRLNFILPTDNTKCFGTYVLSTTKGTWSIICEKNNMNASGTLKWNNKNGRITGNGKDQKGRKVKFKVAGIN